ncbi:polysaccharide pyruvyl transferase family protein [Pseudoalteromonas fuliginea]|uniref:Polysaccharide pyruvyl transferase family protein n=1 Tax=Pseudoalteromonas fuliginea TaxID=1872678 RepID=A0ABQ6RNH4_9GAMM|nr:polysaccharide pyruvyl transferase family protein [Pseudoalteromonas fuliginea]KAA1166424.1 polysaccharide pyruvyl transferase family protein [Pseudoalteromonas fuliginea]KAA1169978.1 polysaccharide pyruvyl transferase family protein [Pseudoalteromonas fuliginea]
MSKFNLVNGFFPKRNFGDDMFLACAHKYVEGDYKVRNDEKSSRNYLEWLNFLKNTKHYTWLGGTFIDKDTDLKMLVSMLLEFTLVKLFGAQLSFVSVGLSRDVSFLKKISLQYFCWLADDISVRDKDSFKAYRSYRGNLKLTGDIVVLQKDLFHCNPANSSVGNYTYVSVDKEKSLDILIKNNSLLEPVKGKNAVIQITSPYKEKEQIERSSHVCELLNCKFKIQPYTDYNQVLEFINNADYIITDRLHVAIAGLINSKKVYLFGVSEKLQGIHDLLEFDDHSNLILLT